MPLVFSFRLRFIIENPKYRTHPRHVRHPSSRHVCDPSSRHVPHRLVPSIPLIRPSLSSVHPSIRHLFVRLFIRPSSTRTRAPCLAARMLNQAHSAEHAAPHPPSCACVHACVVRECLVCARVRVGLRADACMRACVCACACIHVCACACACTRVHVNVIHELARASMCTRVCFRPSVPSVHPCMRLQVCAMPRRPVHVHEEEGGRS